MTFSHPRPYLLVQCRDPGDPMREHEVECFERALSAGTGDARVGVVDALARVPTATEVASAPGLLVGGSGDYSVLDDRPWIGRLVAWLRDEAVPSGTPFFGACYGLQALTLALGGRVTRAAEHREMGSIEVRTTAEAAVDPLFAGLPPRFVVQAGHTDRAVAAPPGADLLASSDACPVQAFRVRGKLVWGTQFHPELGPADVAVRFARYAEKYPPPDLPPGAPLSEAPFLKGLRPSEDASRLLERFAGFCAQRAR